MTAVHVKMSENGRLCIPVEMRKALGLQGGGNVVIELAGNEIRIRTLAEVIAHAQELTRQALEGKTGVSVDDFIADRREQARRE